MDLGVLLESPQGSQSSFEWAHARTHTSGAVAAVSCFPSPGSRDLWLSHEAFPQGYPTCHRGVSRSMASKSTQCKENRFPWNGLRHLANLGMVARPWTSSRLSCGERLLLRCDGNAGNSFPTTQGKDPFSRARRRKRCSSVCGRDSRASSRVETAMSGKFWICSKGVKDPLEVPEVRCD